ncbi:MAG TPA: ankyrin repeat domain-containing protein [Caulobacteraceae bacterium]|nr:ankyrin repeat domain-containing protein [Caulobacteraceae bacterium]
MAAPTIAQLKAAIGAGDGAACRALITAEPALAHDWRAIMEAAIFVDLELLASLLEAGADPNAVSPAESRHRPLHRAIETKASVKPRGDRAAAVTLLLDAGADIDAPGCWYDGRPLETAARCAEAAIAELLLRRGSRSDIFAAALMQDPPWLDGELSRHPALAAEPSASGAGPLHLLCASRLNRRSTPALAERLLDCGARADAVAIMRHGQFPVIHFACWGGEADPGVLALLVSRGANPADGLYEALWSGDFAGAGALVDLGASPDGWSHVGKRPLLHDMIQWGRNSAALWLLERDANPNAPDSNGWTALHYAASRGAKGALVDALAAAGADPALRNRDGLTPEAVGKARKATHAGA